MTTTIFRKNKTEACMASDSRVSWVHPVDGFILKWFDSPDFKKTIKIDDVMYGFAGANVIYKAFLKEYTNKANSEIQLDLLVKIAEEMRAQFFILRHDGERLKLFAYSPENDAGAPEIYRSSKDEELATSLYAIGSGKDSKMYKKHKINPSAQTPIYKIISTNQVALKKESHRIIMQRMIDGGTLTREESIILHNACNTKGGDLFTGGIVNMSKNASRKEIDQQVLIMNTMDAQAKAAGAVCASPINATLEKKNLESLGHQSVSKHKVEVHENDMGLMQRMKDQIYASI